MHEARVVVGDTIINVFILRNFVKLVVEFYKQKNKNNKNCFYRLKN